MPIWELNTIIKLAVRMLTSEESRAAILMLAQGRLRAYSSTLALPTKFPASLSALWVMQTLIAITLLKVPDISLNTSSNKVFMGNRRGESYYDIAFDKYRHTCRSSLFT